jgi:lysozyme family protein
MKIPIQYTDVGPDVSTWQVFLVRVGLQIGDIDGIFGKRTRSGTIVFQRATGLQESGVVDSRTLVAAQAAGFGGPSPVSSAVSSVPSSQVKYAAEYIKLFNTCVVSSTKLTSVFNTVSRMRSNKASYSACGDPLGVPWFVVGIIHELECSQSFSKHLHNGDPLTARTVNVPAGRPKNGSPPFNWFVSAIDALKYDKLDSWKDWSLPGILFKFESFNGFGYRNPAINIPSPYLWSFSNHYTKGKFVGDGDYDKNAVSKQCGAAVMLRQLVNDGTLTIT